VNGLSFVPNERRSGQRVGWIHWIQNNCTKNSPDGKGFP